MILLRAQTGHDFSLYKTNTVLRRIEHRMGIHQFSRIAAYVRFLQANPQELELLFKDLLIGVTSFFREPAEWEQLKAKVIPELLKDRPPMQALRVWIPGCATGEEVYSMAIVFREVLEQLKPAAHDTLQIFATDLNKGAIDQARNAVFPANIAADVSPERLDRFFVRIAHGYQVAKFIREMVIFAPQNLIIDPPFTKVDLLCCRNVLIYMKPELQKKLLPLFHYSLNPGGFLFLWSSETIGASTDLFAPLADKTRIYRRLETNLRTAPINFPLSFSLPRQDIPAPAKALSPPADLQSQAEQLLLQQFSPAAVLVNDKGHIIFISGRTGKYLEPAMGKANWNLFAMAREGLRYELAAGFQEALRQKGTVTRKNVKVGTNGGVQAVDLTLQVIAEPQTLRGMVMVVFADVTTLPRRSASSARLALEPDIKQARQQLQTLLEEMQTLREEMQVSQEEAKSANEELQSTNEELQSTNEELNTSKEEMQSMNEELRTLNTELQRKMKDLFRLNSDIKNVLDSTESATLFLDPAFHVRMFTAAVTQLFKLRPADLDRPITDIVSNLSYPDLANHAREVLRTLAVHEEQVTRGDGRWFRVRIMPYRTLENMIDGVVVTFSDITAAKTLEKNLRTTQTGMEEHIAEQDLKLEQAAESLQEEMQRGQTRRDAGSTARPSRVKRTKP